jgi:RNase P protein component
MPIIMKDTTFKDMLILGVSTAATSALFVTFVSLGHMDTVVVGLSAGMCSLAVQANVLRRQLRRLQQQTSASEKSH